MSKTSATEIYSMSLSAIVINETESVGPSSPLSCIFSSPSSDEHSSDPGTPPPIFSCHDFRHCGAVGRPIGAPGCDLTTLAWCPGLNLPGLNLTTPPSLYGGHIHPLPNPIVTCGFCRVHETTYLPGKVVYVDAEATANYHSGHRNQLCHSCLRGEVELYWMRQGTPAPGNSSVIWARQWPLANGLQDLCTCATTSIAIWANTHCHACRDTIFLETCWRPYTNAEDILRRHTKPVITGKKRCRLQDATQPENRISNTVFNNRRARGIGRMCPCGEKPKLPSNLEYITVCFSCSGVRIDPANLPPELQQGPIMETLNRRQRLRPRPLARTKGPRAAARSHMFRVNIEFGWLLPGDTRVGGQ